jgi:prepilin peptidase CpaA
MTISNRISLILTVGFFALALLLGMSATDVAWHVAAGVAVLAITFTFFSLGWIGGGDAKLAAVTAMWLGFDHLLNYAVYASLFGGILTMAVIKLRMSPLPAMLAGQEWIERLHRSDAGVPYGIALAAAALMVYPDTVWMMGLAAH